MAVIVEVASLAKKYGKVEVLRGLDLLVSKGQVYAYLGRNGAGKTTTLRILVGITRPDSGTVRLFGRSIEGHHIELRQKVGYVAQEQNFYGWMTPHSLGRFVGGFYPTWDEPRYQQLLTLADLPQERKIRTFSGGMKARLALSVALAHRPPLLILDEPTAGLDPVARREFPGLVREQAEQQGHTTLFSSHLVDEVERVAGQVGIIESGRMVFEGPLNELSSQVRMVRDLPPECPTPTPSRATGRFGPYEAQAVRPPFCGSRTGARRAPVGPGGCL